MLSTGLMKLRLRDNFGLVPLGEKKAALPKSLKGTERIAQGKAEGRDPGNGSHTGADPEGVERSVTEDVAPLQGAEVGLDASPGLHPGLLSVSPSATGGTYRVIGEPEDLDSAKQLAQDDRYGFQWWILPLIGARSLGASDGSKVGKKGADAGIDGLMVFTDDNSGKAKKVIVSVKSGHVNVAQIRDLAHVVARENAAIGVFVTLEPPTRPMVQEAVTAGFYHSEYWHRDYPKIQILTVEQILSSKGVAYPGNMGNVNTFKRAEKIGKEPDDQWPLGFD